MRLVTLAFFLENFVVQVYGFQAYVVFEFREVVYLFVYLSDDFLDVCVLEFIIFVVFF